MTGAPGALAPACFALALAVVLAACGAGQTAHGRETTRTAMISGAANRLPGDKTAVPSGRPGGYYLDDGPAGEIPSGLEQVPDAAPVWEPINAGTTRPYVVFGRAYTPRDRIQAFRQRGVASWYGKKFHGLKTSSGEPYDMFAMTAAHTVLPIPSYVRVSNPANGKSVIVRINDRGPFHAERIIDLSYTAALKLGYLGRGSTEVEVEQIVPAGDPIEQLAAARAPNERAEPRADGGDELAALIERLENTGDGAPRPGETTSGYYLQMGAFGNADNADNLRLHLERELDWLDEAIRVHADRLADGRPIHRVRAGPFAGRDRAERAAEKIGETLGQRPAVVTR